MVCMQMIWEMVKAGQTVDVTKAQDDGCKSSDLRLFTMWWGQDLINCG